jgi:hypothetical protein
LARNPIKRHPTPAATQVAAATPAAGMPVVPRIEGFTRTI